MPQISAAAYGPLIFPRAKRTQAAAAQMPRSALGNFLQPAADRSTKYHQNVAWAKIRILAHATFAIQLLRIWQLHQTRFQQRLNFPQRFKRLI